jgi:hypothetical protein
MASYWERLVKLYGEGGIAARPVCLLRDAELGALTEYKVDSFEGLVSQVMQTIKSS